MRGSLPGGHAFDVHLHTNSELSQEFFLVVSLVGPSQGLWCVLLRNITSSPSFPPSLPPSLTPSLPPSLLFSLLSPPLSLLQLQFERSAEQQWFKEGKSTRNHSPFHTYEPLPIL